MAFRAQSQRDTLCSEFFRRDAELTACHCEPGAEFGWRPQLATFASDIAKTAAAAADGGEKRRQREFIKKHTGIKVSSAGLSFLQLVLATRIQF